MEQQHCEDIFSSISASPLPSSIRTEGIFSHSKAEAILQRLLDITARHQAELSRLNNRTSDASTNNSLFKKIECIQQSIDSLANRISDIERRITIPNLSSTTLGEAVAANRRSLARTMQLISTKTDVNKFNSLKDLVTQNITQTETKLRQDLADKHSLYRLSDSISSFSQRMDVLSKDLANKVDNTLFKTISSDAAAIRDHAAFVTKINQICDTLENDAKQNSENIDQQEEVLSSLTDHVEILQREVNERTSVNDFYILKNHVQELKSSIQNTVASKTEFEILNTNVEQISNQISILETNTSQCENRTELLTQRLDKLHTRKEIESLLDKCVQKVKFHDILRDLRAEIGAKAWDRSLVELFQDHEITKRHLEQLREDHDTTKQRAGLAAQFVDWYGRRGDAYEHNFRAVDGHLKNLVVGEGERRSGGVQQSREWR